jgi:hypothetical protein
MEWMTSVAIGLALVVAIRSTWSPCGVSMLSSITPLSERGRGHRYPATITWFLIGSLLGGLTLGSLAALGAMGVSAMNLAPVPTGWVVLAVALTTLGSDLAIMGFRLPANPRQVNRTWLDEYRPWVYAIGFGWQLGVGVATYVMTAAVYLLVVVAASTGNPLAALGIVTLFGFTRGLAILPASTVKTQADLFRLHRTMERYRPLSRIVAAAAQFVILGAVAVFLWGAVIGVVVTAVLMAMAWALRGRLTDPLPYIDERPSTPIGATTPIALRAR